VITCHRYLPLLSTSVPYLAEKSHGDQISDLPSTYKFRTDFHPNSSDSSSCATLPSTQTIVISAQYEHKTSPAYCDLYLEPFSLPLFEVSHESKTAQHHNRLCSEQCQNVLSMNGCNIVHSNSDRPYQQKFTVMFTGNVRVFPLTPIVSSFSNR